MIEYHIHIHGSRAANYVFESNWQYSDKEVVFIHENKTRKGYVINQVTHDVIVRGTETIHIVRLNCHEKKIY